MTRTEDLTGRKAPDFSLLDQDDRTVDLASLAGSWVVLNYTPTPHPPGSPPAACEYTDAIAVCGARDAVVLGCSPDSPASHARFAAKYSLKVRLLSDPDHAVMERYGAWGEKSMYGRTSQGVIRSTVIIDPNGVVAHHWPTVKAAGHAAAVRDRLAALRSAASA